MAAGQPRWRHFRRTGRLLRIHLMQRFGINGLLPTPAPLASVRYPLAPAGAYETLGVLLPGIRDVPEDFGRYGFISAARQQALPWDLVAVDTHYGYFHQRSVVARLHEDVILPARAAGYARVWLVGISLGGLGSLLYAAEHSDEVAGIVLFAPFLGFSGILDEIRTAGGAARWLPEEMLKGELGHDFQYTLWRWLQRYADPDAGLPKLLLGYGADDDFAPANRLLAELLPTEQVRVIPGGHDWSTWRALWRLFLQYDLSAG